VELSAANWRQLWVPPGFAHGYVTLEDDCEVIYKVTDYYAPEFDRGIAWDDPALAINWRLPAGEIILSDKDRKQPRIGDAQSIFKFGQ
jgi:dTDP-4-dehydrorhamnose 3,5-epimerase